MMRSFNALGLGLVALAGFGACSDGGNTAEPPGKKIELAVAPLSLPGITQACFDVVVKNQVGQVVWFQGDPEKGDGATDFPLHTTAADSGAGPGGSICSGQFGNGPGGDIAYVGPCDASPSNQNHTVTVWIHNLFGLPNSGSDPQLAMDAGEWDNPCPSTAGTGLDQSTWTGGCTLGFTCVENADVPVTFNFTILRDANQGFFDVAINFADVFCSAKLDNCDNTNNAINLIFPTGSADRVKTTVLAFACTGGANETSSDTWLYTDPIKLTCDGGANNFTIPMTGTEGNHQLVGAADNLTYALYRGQEDLDCGGGVGSCRKLYMSAAWENSNCTIATRFTARGSDMVFSGGNATDKWTTPFNSSYAYVDVNATTAGDASCQKYDLGSNEVAPKYTEFAGGTVGSIDFCYQYGPADADPVGSTSACP